MAENTFDKLWDETIFPSIEFCIKSIDNTIESIDDTKDFIDLKTPNNTIYKKELQKLYKRKREWLKKEYLPSEGANAVLDFHKLSVIMCRSIIGNKYFKFSEKKANLLFKQIDNSRIPKKEKLKKEINTIYINYKLAFYVATGISYIDLLVKATTKKEKETDINKIELLNIFINRLIEYGKLYRYRENNRHDDLESSIIIALMKNDILKRDFDYLAYSALMYQWQEHTKSEICFDILCDGKSSLSIDELRELIMTI